MITLRHCRRRNSICETARFKQLSVSSLFHFDFFPSFFVFFSSPDSFTSLKNTRETLFLSYRCFFLVPGVRSFAPLKCFSFSHVFVLLFSSLHVPTGSSSRGGDVAVYIFEINQPDSPTTFYSVLEPASVFIAL